MKREVKNLSGSSNRFLMSLPEILLKYIDETIEVINLTKKPYAKKVNRQAVIRGIMEYCKKADLQFSSGYTRHVYVSNKLITE